MVCLDSHYRQYRGEAAQARGCRKVGRIPTSGIAYHPYTLRGGPARPRRPAATPRSASSAGVDEDDSTRSRGAASSRAGCRSGSPSSASRPSPPDPFRRVAEARRRRSWTRASGSRSATRACELLAVHALGRAAAHWRTPVPALVHLAVRAALRRRQPKPSCTTRSACRSSCARSARTWSRFSAADAPARARRPDRGQGAGRAATVRSRPSPVNESGYFRQVVRRKKAYRHTYRVTARGRTRVKRPPSPSTAVHLPAYKEIQPRARRTPPRPSPAHRTGRSAAS